MTKSIKLTYFPIKARGEPIRLALSIAGLDFEDERLTKEQFVAIKETLPFKQLPVLTVDGRTYAQSNAILRYIGKLDGKLYPQDAEEALSIDQILDHVEDIHKKIYPSLWEKDAVKKMELRKELVENTFPELFSMLEALPRYAANHVKQEVLVYIIITLFLVSFNCRACALPTLQLARIGDSRRHSIW